MQQKTIYFPGLNGLRAIAALSVLISHTISPEFSDFGLTAPFKLPLAQFGVTLFFVISGFLITYLLIEEKSHYEINIKKFYLRRILRIWPLYYMYIAVCFAVWMLMKTNKFELTTSIYWYLFLSANVPFILNKGIILLVHYWSLGVEEQFYIFWPLFVKYNKGNRLIFYTVIASLLIFFIKILAWYYLGKESTLYRSISVTRFHCMMVGAVGALIFTNTFQSYLELITHKLTQIITWALFIGIGCGLLNLPAPIAHEFFAILSLVLIYGQITKQKKVINLEKKGLNYIGKISYGIYVIHPLIIYLLSSVIKTLPINKSIKYLVVYSIIVTTTFIFAYLSYKYVESPFLRFKSKYMTIRSSAVAPVKIVWSQTASNQAI